MILLDNQSFWNMKKSLLFVFVLVVLSVSLNAQKSSWKIAGDKIVSPWSEKANPLSPLPDYPRPQMVRTEWMNLNGLWDYAISPLASPKPSSFQGKILVPFAIESALSGVNKNVGKDSLLWYRTSFALPPAMKGKTILLHFGAVDWKSEVYINGAKMGTHEGGYDPFSFNITQYLKKSSLQMIELSVWDPSDKGPQPRGKQVTKPGSIWYTAVTGIWQTVWLEAVPETYIVTTKQTPDIDKQTLTISAEISGEQAGDRVKFSAWDGAALVSEIETSGDTDGVLQVKNPKLCISRCFNF